VLHLKHYSIPQIITVLSYVAYVTYTLQEFSSSVHHWCTELDHILSHIYAAALVFCNDLFHSSASSLADCPS